MPNGDLLHAVFVYLRPPPRPPYVLAVTAILATASVVSRHRCPACTKLGYIAVIPTFPPCTFSILEIPPLLER